MILEDAIMILASPASVFRFFDTMESNYLAWHPDHVRFRWERGRGVVPGNVYAFEEQIAGKLLKKRVVFTHVVANQYIKFAPTFWLMRLFLPCMLFRIIPEQGGCRFSAEIHLRMGPLAQRAHRQELAAIRKHMREEGEHLKCILEAEEAEVQRSTAVSQ